MKNLTSIPVAFFCLIFSFVPAALAAEKPNILIIWGDDIGPYNISAYNMGRMGVLGTSPPQITLRPETRAWQGFQEDPTFSVSQIHRSTGLRSPSY